MSIMYCYCYSRKEFIGICASNRWSDDTPPPINTAIISICSTEDVRNEDNSGEPDNHVFEKNHRNVLNLDFDDISQKEEEIETGKAYGISKSQALEVVKFIRDGISEGINYFIIHCGAGRSRSQAVVRYILDTYSRIRDIIIRPDNPPTTYNSYVLGQLKKAGKIILWKNARK